MSSICDLVYYITPRDCTKAFVNRTIGDLFNTHPANRNDITVIGYWNGRKEEWINTQDIIEVVDVIVKEEGGLIEFSDSENFNFQIEIWPRSSEAGYGFIKLRFDRTEISVSVNQRISEIITYAKRVCNSVSPSFVHGGYELDWIDFNPTKVPFGRLLSQLSWINFIRSDQIENPVVLNEITTARWERVNNHYMIQLSSAPHERDQISNSKKRVIEILSNPDLNGGRK